MSVGQLRAYVSAVEHLTSARPYLTAPSTEEKAMVLAHARRYDGTTTAAEAVVAYREANKGYKPDPGMALPARIVKHEMRDLLTRAADALQEAAEGHENNPLAMEIRAYLESHA